MAEDFEIHRALEPVYADWEDLAGRLNSGPFVRPGWIRAWHQTFGSGELEIHVLKRDGRAVALAPFVRKRRSLNSPTNWHTPQYEILAENRDAAVCLLRRTVEQMPPRLLCRFVLGDGITASALHAVASEVGVRVFERGMARSPVIPLEGDFETYRQGLSKNMRKNLSRRRARIEELGDVEFAVIRGGPEFEAGFEAALALEASGWKGQKGTAIASDVRTRRFYADVAEWAAEVGILRLVLLRAGGIPIAFDLGLETNGTYYSLKTGYDSSHHKLGPGAELTYALIRHCFDEGLKRLALLGSEDEFKRKWSGGAGEDLIELQAFKGHFAPIDRLIQVNGRTLARNAIERARNFRT